MSAATPTAREVLADEAFGFCHDPHYPLLVDEALWCPLLPVDQPPCPAFASACDAARGVITGASGPLGSRQHADGSNDGEAAARDRTPTDHARTTQPEPASDLGPLPHVLVWIVVGVMVVALLMQLRGPTRTRTPLADDVPRDPAEPQREPVSPPPPIETDVDRLLARAVQRADRGDLDGAVTDGHAAMIRRLAERGHVHLHPSRTNGDHVRDLGTEPTLRVPAQRVVRIVERVQFGHTPITRPEVDDLIAQVRSVLSTLVGALVLAWISLACTSHAANEYPWSHSPSGTAGVLTLLRGHGFTVGYRTSALEGLELDGPTPIVLDDASLDTDEQSALIAHVRRGGRAVLATQEPLPTELNIRSSTRDKGPLWWGPSVDAQHARRVMVPGDAGLIADDPSAQVLRHDGQGTAYALVTFLGAGRVLVLADDHLLTNAALAVPDNADFLVEQLRGLGDRFELIDGGLRTAGGTVSSNPLATVASRELAPVIAQLLLFVALLYLWRGTHFGRPRDTTPPSRRRFGEHAEALAAHYHRAGAQRHALRLYAGWALERIATRFGGQHRGLHHLARRIAARTDRDETEIMRTLVEAHDARDDERDALGGSEDLRVLRELGRLIDTTRGPR